MPARIAVIALVGYLLVQGPARLSLAAERGQRIDAKVNALVLNHRLSFEEAGAAHQLGEAGLPRLCQILADSALQESWPQAATVIGLIGGRRSFEILRDFIWSRFRGPVDGLTLAALSSAVLALGYSCDSDHAVPLLETHADPPAWADIPWTAYDVSEEAKRVLMSDHSIAALGYCCSPEAGRALRRLIRNPTLSSRRQRISAAIETHDQVMKLGLQGYWTRPSKGSGSGLTK